MPATTAAVLQPPPPPPPPVAAAANRVLSADRLEKLAVAFVCVANAILLARSPKAGASDAAWQAASAALPFLVLVLMLRLSRPAYLRVRAVLVPLLRLAYHAQRSERSATETVAGVLLHGAPLPRAAGAAFDALRILLGVRLLSNAMISLLFPLPLPIAAAVHAAIVALTANSDAYCSAPLLSHPTMQRRLGRLSSLLHTSTALATPMGSSIARQPPTYACADVLRWLVLLFTAVPIVLLAWQEAAATQEQPRHGTAAAAVSEPSRGVAPVATRALRCAHGTLRTACFCRLGRSARCAALAWLASVLWLIATF